jgi:very-short-patch-repair endonuclease
MTRRPPHPSRPAAAPPSPARGEGQKEKNLPSPLAGEDAPGLAPGADEGSLPQLQFARKLRRDNTPAEKKLWSALRDRRFAAYKFRRQVPVGSYVADFICFEARLIVEVDGSQHAESPKDVARDAWLVSQNFLVKRFWNDEVLNDLEAVLDTIATIVETRAQPRAVEENQTGLRYSLAGNVP